MVSLDTLLWVFVVIFGVIGSMRGWAKEMLVGFSVVLALFIINILQTLVPFVADLAISNPDTMFWLRTVLLIALVVFGYQTPNIGKLASSNHFARERLQDALLGALLGALNGFLIFGTLWYFMHENNYSAVPFILPMTPGSEMYDSFMSTYAMLPPQWLMAAGSNLIYFVIAIAFAFVLVVLI
jgi:uncharacterized membrane protein required for colicin V production